MYPSDAVAACSSATLVGRHDDVSPFLSMTDCALVGWNADLVPVYRLSFPATWSYAADDVVRDLVSVADCDFVDVAGWLALASQVGVFHVDGLNADGNLDDAVPEGWTVDSCADGWLVLVAA